MLHAIPDGAHCFVDANIICYHVINVPPLSLECESFFNRLQTKQVLATTLTALVTEAIHKVMLAEAVQKHGLDHRGLAHRLQRQRNLIADLEEHHKVPALLRAAEIHVEPISIEIIERASELSQVQALDQ